MKVETTFGIPVYILDEGVELPNEGTYYIVASNGLFMHKDSGLVQATVPVKGVSVLRDLENVGTVTHNLKKLPWQATHQIKRFFAKVVERFHSESCVILFYNRETGSYVVHVPEQFVSHGGVAYRRSGLTHLPELEGYVPVGTIHSHCDFQAFHSGTDVGDEEFWDGLHVTFGHNDRQDFTIAASIVSNGARTKIEPSSILDGISHIQLDFYKLEQPITVEELDAIVEPWMEKVRPFPKLRKEELEDEENSES